MRLGGWGRARHVRQGGVGQTLHIAQNRQCGQWVEQGGADPKTRTCTSSPDNNFKRVRSTRVSGFGRLDLLCISSQCTTEVVQ